MPRRDSWPVVLPVGPPTQPGQARQSVERATHGVREVDDGNVEEVACLDLRPPALDDAAPGRGPLSAGSAPKGRAVTIIGRWWEGLVR